MWPLPKCGMWMADMLAFWPLDCLVHHAWVPRSDTAEKSNLLHPPSGGIISISIPPDSPHTRLSSLSLQICLTPPALDLGCLLSGESWLPSPHLLKLPDDSGSPKGRSWVSVRPPACLFWGECSGGYGASATPALRSDPAGFMEG